MYVSQDKRCLSRETFRNIIKKRLSFRASVLGRAIN